MSASRVTTAFRLGLREFRRTPVLLALLVFLPAYAVGVFAYLAPDAPAVIHLTDAGAVEVGLSEAFPAFTTPMVAALLTGLAGLFLMHTAADADGRLVAAGYRAYEVVLARLGMLVVVAGIGTIAAVAIMLVAFTPEYPAWFVFATFLTALIYGMVGVLAGVLLDRLPGVYLVLFGALVDLFLFQNPLAEDESTVALLMPGHFPLELGMEAAFGANVPLEMVGYSIVVLGTLTLLAAGSFYRTTRVK